MLPILVALAAGFAAAPAAPAANQPAPPIATASGLRILTLAAGSGDRPQPTDWVLVNYEGRLADGKVFDASTQPTPMRVSDVVAGFGEALQLMQKGGRYRIWIPANLAYGEQGAGGVIPPNAELDITVALLFFAPEFASDAQ